MACILFLDIGDGNPPMWTLAREEYFYVLYLGLLAWRRTWGIATAVVGVLALGLAYPFIDHLLLPVAAPTGYTVYPSAFVLWIQWVLGMVAAEAYYGVIKLPHWCRMAWMVPFWFLISELSQIYVPALSTISWV